MSKTRNATGVVAGSKKQRRLVAESFRESRAARAASYAMSADTTAAIAVAAFSKSAFGDVLEEAVGHLENKLAAIHSGDLKDAEALLMGQTVGLNAMYTELVRIGRLNVTNSLDVAERLIRLGLKAQGQCRATVETLAAIKNPPTVFARQANIAQGPQQVNNTVSLAAGKAPHADRGKQRQKWREMTKALNAALRAQRERLVRTNIVCQ